MREAERREQAALQYAQAAKKELEENQKKNLSLDSSYVTEFENRIKLQDQLYRNTLKEAIEDEDWELVREVIAYLKADDVFEDYRQEEDWFKGADDN